MTVACTPAGTGRTRIEFRRHIDRIARETNIAGVAVSFFDYETQKAFSYRGDHWFHAASTIKVAILMGIFSLVEEGAFDLESPVCVSNRFESVVDGKPFSVDRSRDGCPSLYSSLDKTVPVLELAYHMVVTSSNLATNLLVELAGVTALQQKLDGLGVQGVELRRGVEDEVAWEQGINNRITADGLLQLFRLIYGSNGMAPELSARMIDILADQKFNQGLPVGIPAELRARARFAHKTGEISTVEHDAGLVYLPGRQPYGLSILTERIPGESKSRQAIQALSSLVYRRFVCENGAG